MSKRKGKPRHFGLMLMLIVIVFLSLLVQVAFSGLLMFFLIENGILSVSDEMYPGVATLIRINAAVSVPLGLIVALMVVKFPLRPIRELINGMDTLASGDFSVRVNPGSIMRKYPTFVGVAKSFNKMAEQLENTEMLHSDFVNNLSHEFKTPIVSIAGFAKLLRRGKLDEETQQTYLQAIEEESLRLSIMATNVLGLTKIENQTILSDVTQFNLSEQIRSCILILERKWEEKNIDLHVEFGEHSIHANEELLKQVWLNLLDNAVKFTPEGHMVQVKIAESDHELQVSILNTGSTITPEQQKKIFNKFYQADESHTTAGNGVGLAIVKRVTELHGGHTVVSSEYDVTVFTVYLPK